MLAAACWLLHIPSQESVPLFNLQPTLGMAYGLKYPCTFLACESQPTPYYMYSVY